MDENRLKALDLAVSQIEKQFGKGAIMKLGEGGVIPDVSTIGLEAGLLRHRLQVAQHWLAQALSSMRREQGDPREHAVFLGKSDDPRRSDRLVLIEYQDVHRRRIKAVHVDFVWEPLLVLQDDLSDALSLLKLSGRFDLLDRDSVPFHLSLLSRRTE